MLNAVDVEPRVNVQLSGDNLAWAFDSLAMLVRPASTTPEVAIKDLRSLYARLAREYDELPAVATRSGGLPGEAIEI